MLCPYKIHVWLAFKELGKDTKSLPSLLIYRLNYRD
jgi:hypothetical protein